MKTNIIRRCMATIAAGALMATAVAHNAPRLLAADESPTIQFVAGDVQILTGATAKKATVGDRVNLKDTVVTGKDAMTDLQFGESGMVRINENTRVTVTAMLSDQKADAQAELSQGSIYCLFAKLMKNSSFQVKTSTAVASVRGTGFRVAEDADGSDLSVLEGKVQVAPLDDGKVRQDLATTVDEDHGIRLRRAEMRAMIKERRALRAMRIDERMRTRYFSDVAGIRKRAGFERMHGNIRTLIDDRIMKRRELRRERREENKDRKEPMRDKKRSRIEGKDDDTAADRDDRDQRRDTSPQKKENKGKQPRRGGQ